MVTLLPVSLYIICIYIYNIYYIIWMIYGRWIFVRLLSCGPFKFYHIDQHFLNLIVLANLQIPENLNARQTLCGYT